jgi:hydrogenase maturation protease
VKAAYGGVNAPRVLVLGWGNPGRQDDGLGPAIVEELEKLRLPGVIAEADYQLSIENAADLAEADKAIFVDAAVEGAEPFEIRRVEPSTAISFSTHAFVPGSVLALCEQAYGRAPEALLVGVRGYSFELAEGLTEKALMNAGAALGFITSQIREWRGNNMATGERTKTILIIDDDPDIRAATRIVLESAGFVVGEASTGAEGLKVAQRIKPDAVLLDLMMETVDAGSKVSTQLKEAGFSAPIFLLSSVGDAVRYNIDAAQLGLAGIFQKPIDHRVLLTTLKAELHMK